MNLGQRLQQLFKWMDQGRRSYLIISGLLLLSSVLVYLNPRSLPAFLLLLSVPLLLYFLHTTGRFKALIAILLLLGIMPVVGIRNIFYLEVAFR